MATNLMNPSVTATRTLPRSVMLSTFVLLWLAATTAHALPPTWTTIGPQSVREGENLVIPLAATDPDGEGLVLSQSGVPGFCTFTDDGDGTGDIDCTPPQGSSGIYPITVTATDDADPIESTPESFTLAVTANTAPSVGAIADRFIVAPDAFNIGMSWSDIDGDDATFTISGEPGFCSLVDDGSGDGIGRIRCIAAAGDGGSWVIAVTATDDAPFPASGTTQFTLNVNTAPVITPIGNLSMAEGELLNIPLSATDADGDDLTFTQNALPGFCSLTDNGNGTGNITCNPQAGDGGSYDVTVFVTDDGVSPLGDFDDFTLNVGSNTAPVLTSIDNQSVAEGDSLSIPLSATDADGDDLSFSTTNLPGFCLLTDNGNGTGAIDCSPGSGDGGSYGVIVTVTDDAAIPGEDSDGFTLNVSANTPPVLANIDNQSVIEGGTLNITLSASDADGDGLTFSTTDLPAFCALTDNGDGTGAIDCNPLVGDADTYVPRVTVTDDAPVPASDFDLFVLTVTANEPPVASNVTISGVAALGEVLTGSYSYSDAEDDTEGTSTFRWLRNGAEIPGAIGTTYTVIADDIETDLQFEVTPVAQAGAPQGDPVLSAAFRISNSAPSITAQVPIEIDEDTSWTITRDDITVVDNDNTWPDDFSDDDISVGAGANYTVVDRTVTPDPNFNGDLSVSITINDGFADSPAFPLAITVRSVNDQPVITGQSPLQIDEDTSLVISVDDLVIDDPDNGAFTLALQDGLNYTRSNNTITPDENFNGELTIPATVTEAPGPGEDPVPLESTVFNLVVNVASVNDLPVLEAPIEPQNAIEDAPFTLDITGNFSDADGDQLAYTATWLPQKPPNIDFNGNTGVFSGTPREVDADAPGPVYSVTVTATDPSGDFVSADPFDLTILLLDRANLSLSIDVTPDTGMPNDELRWTFTARNPVGPQPGEDVELNGSIVGVGLTVTESGSATCTIEPEVNDQIDFSCTLGALPVGGSSSTVLVTQTSEATEVVAFATAAGARNIPIDPNLDDNSDIESTGVADSFSVGAVQILGSATVRSVAAGDINGDGRADIVVGTAAGQPVQVFVNDANRESCDCLRDFVRSPISIPDTGSNEGVDLADFDNNGTLDLIVANGGGQPDVIFSNDGAGNFTSLATLGNSFAQGVAVGDFNDDGNMDIAIAAVGANPVYLGNGVGGFSLDSSLGNANSADVVAARFDGDSRVDLVFANVGSASRVWTKNAGAGFSAQQTLAIGDAMAVAAGDLDGDGDRDLVFGRMPSGIGDIPRNPLLLNDGSGNFGNPVERLGISPTQDVQIGDVNGDGSPDIVFINASGVHQTWLRSGNSYTLHGEQIIDQDARAGVLLELGDADNGDPGGVDLAMGGASSAGIGVYLNDGSGNLGRGDDVPPVITLRGEANVIVTSGSYTDAGATALDNIDGDISAEIIVTSTVNTTIVGNYTVTYNVEDFAGNQATTVVRNVEVAVASGGGGGGGGALSLGMLAALVGLLLVPIIRIRED